MLASSKTKNYTYRTETPKGHTPLKALFLLKKKKKKKIHNLHNAGYSISVNQWVPNSDNKLQSTLTAAQTQITPCQSHQKLWGWNLYPGSPM